MPPKTKKGSKSKGKKKDLESLVAQAEQTKISEDESKEEEMEVAETKEVEAVRDLLPTQEETPTEEEKKTEEEDGIEKEETKLSRKELKKLKKKV